MFSPSSTPRKALSGPSGSGCQATRLWRGGAISAAHCHYPRQFGGEIPGRTEAMGNKSVGVIVGILALLVCVGPGMVWAQKGPVKIGVITPMTGAAAAIGKDMVNGLSMYLEQNSQQIAGRKV